MQFDRNFFEKKYYMLWTNSTRNKQTNTQENCELENKGNSERMLDG